jgi:6-phosphogluconolactonase
VSEAEIRVVEDPAGEVATLLEQTAVAGGHVVLTGGSSPRRAYEIAAERDADWSGAVAWFGDERCVPPAHPDSNFAMADHALLSRLSEPPVVKRIEGELEPEAAAGAYEAEIREALGGDPRWDLLLLGVGPDGHTASLFPGSEALAVDDRLVVATGDDAHPHPRLTLTFPGLARGDVAVVTVEGADKAEAWRRVQAGDDVPAARIPAGEVVWLVDPAAAGTG